jgi:hypothetical protein
MCMDCSEVNFLILDVMYYHDMDLVHTKKWLVAIIFCCHLFSEHI